MDGLSKPFLKQMVIIPSTSTDAESLPYGFLGFMQRLALWGLFSCGAFSLFFSVFLFFLLE